MIAFTIAGFIVLRLAVQLWLDGLNRRHVAAHADSVPAAFKATMDQTTYVKSVQYTLAKSRLSQFEDAYDTIILLVVVFSGLLPWSFDFWHVNFGASVWAMAAFLFASAVVLALPGLPINWYAQFRLEEKFGFNTSTAKLWWTDKLKALLLAIVLGYPLLVLVLSIVRNTGAAWWLWAWGCVLGFQLLMVVLAPIVILPWFNKLTPLPESSLRDRLMSLASQTGFQAKGIQVMDGSKRSRHSNAFFTGFGRFRRIVLFDTLIEQLSEPELEAVLAHEIGHYQKKHIPKMLVWFGASLFAGFFAVAWLAQQTWFYQAFGFETGNIVPALLLFSLLGGVFTFWFSPLQNPWSRRYEYQADAYAAQTVGETASLIGALRKLNIKNLSNLTPHPLYSGFYYSHPTLLEREQALTNATA